MNVLLIGASDKPDRYAYLAFQLLRQHHHDVFPIHPKLQVIDGVKVYPSVKDVPLPVDTVTLYIGALHSDKIVEDIVNLHPRRIIFNPGAENDRLEEAAVKKGILTLHACTLVMLKTGQF